jgi:hypothetical protein
VSGAGARKGGFEWLHDALLSPGVGAQPTKGCDLDTCPTAGHELGVWVVGAGGSTSA